jgi:hypothetical protein
MYNITLRHVRETIVAVEKEKKIACCKCVVGLIIQHAKHMHSVILTSVAYPAIPFFPYYLMYGTIFGKKVIEHEMCVLIFSTSFV